MSKRKIITFLMVAVMAGGIFTGCGEDTSNKKSEENKESQQSAIPVPEGEELDAELMEEFVQANELSNLCKKYGNIRIDTSYVYMDENGKKSDGGKDSMVYTLGENGIVSGNTGDGYSSYTASSQLTYSKYQDMETPNSVVNYSVCYYSNSFNKLMEEFQETGLYAGSEYVETYCYKETADGYEIYEVYDWGDGTGNVITYYANKDKVVTKSESMCYPKNAARYVDCTRALKTGVETTPKQLEEFENGEITVTIIENASGNQMEVKVPAGTEFSFIVDEVEAATLDPEGTQFVGGDRYESMLTVNENVTVYIAEVGREEEMEEESLFSDTEPVG